MSSSSLNGSTKKLQWKPHDCLCGSLRDLHGKLPKFTYFEIYNFEIKECNSIEDRNFSDKVHTSK